jgi:tripartite ATP-independent transporter DctP family solute receptor
MVMGTSSISRRSFAVGAGAVLAATAAVRSPAKAAQFTYKFANVEPVTSTLNVRSKQMWDAVREETGGRLDVQIFPQGVLGSDPAAFSQLRAGAIQFYPVFGGLLENSLVEAAGIESLPFAFKTRTAPFAAYDGDLGAYLRKEIIAKGVYAFPKVYDGGFRIITSGTKAIRTPEDLSGFKIRIPDSRIWQDLFKTLAASPVSVETSQIYTACQTHLCDGVDNVLFGVDLLKLYEVQKYLSVTNHMWYGQWLVANMEAWNALPADIRAIVERNQAKYALLQRADSIAKDLTYVQKLQGLGMATNTVEAGLFSSRLGAFYGRWKTNFGSTAWNMLEKYTGKLG